MHAHINVGHPFYFPTQVVLVDDDPDFLDGVSLLLDKEHAERLEQIRAPAQLIREVKNGENLPIFDEQDETLGPDHPCIRNWQVCYHPAVKIHSTRNMYATLVKDNDLPDCYQGDIIPYRDFMESNSLDREILH